MVLVTGMVVGMVVGIALMAGWCQMMRYRSRERRTKAVEIKLLGPLTRNDLRKICGDNIPEWISFREFEQVKWLNKKLSKVWPFIAEATTMVIKESVEPLLEDYRPPGISSLKFSKLFLGNVPPKVEANSLHEGVRVQKVKEGQVTLDIDFRWGGNLSIIFQVEAVVASLPIQLKDLQIFTMIRVIFQLSEDIPCISAVVFSLLSEPQPRIDYTLKAVGGNLTAIPGLSDMIDDTVNSIVSDMLQWPHRIIVPIGGIPVDLSELELKPQGKLSVTVVKANALKNMEMFGKSDPYVVLFIRPLLKFETKVIDNNLNPVWNETFELIVEDKETQSVKFEVFDKDIAQDKRLGVAKLPLIELEPETLKEFDLRLLASLDMSKVQDKRDKGTLTIKVLYHQLSKEGQVASQEELKRIMEERRKLKTDELIGSTMDAFGGAASMVGSGMEAGAELVGSGVGTMTSGLSKAGKFMSKSMKGPFSCCSRRDGSDELSGQANEG